MVKAAVENNDVEAAVETLGAVVHGGEKGEGAVGVVVKISSQEPVVRSQESIQILACSGAGVRGAGRQGGGQEENDMGRNWVSGSAGTFGGGMEMEREKQIYQTE